MLKDKHFYKGVNFGGWLSQCDYSEKRLNEFITEDDFRKAASWGVDHVRIPFDYNILEDNNGNYIEDGFRRLENAVLLSRKYGLNTVLDLHKTAGFSFDDYGEDEHGFFESHAYQERFCCLWEKLAERFGKYSDTVAFELLNEVTDQSFIDVWNRVADECIGRIRKIAPDTLIFVGSYHNNSAQAVKDLDPPHDSLIVYNMHCYDPLDFTHQGAYWTDKIDQSRRFPYSESGCSAAYFEELFASAIEKAEKYGVPLYCGEYGVIDQVPPTEAIRWFRDINSVFEKHGIGRCVWSYKEMDFGISDQRYDNDRSELLKYI